MRIRKMLAGGVAAVALVPAAALAQQAPSAQSGDEAVQVDEIIVTARKRSERLFDVPVAVTAVTAETLEERQLTSVRDVAAITPGLNINSDAAGRAFISIRGIGTTLLDTVQPGVGIFVDGVYQANTSYLNSPTLAVEQIEVLRGPQSTLFGQNTLGGAINVTTKRPSDVVEGQVTGTYAGPDNYYIAAGTIAGPVVEGVVTGRLSVGVQSRDGFLRNKTLNTDAANPLEQTSVRGALLFDLPGAAELTVNAYSDRVEGTAPLYALTTGPTAYTDEIQTNLPSRATYDYTGLNGKLETPISDSTDLTVVLAYDKRESDLLSDGDFQPIPLFVSASQGDLETKTAEARFDTRWSDTLSTLVGVFTSEQITEARNRTTIVPLGVTVPATATSNADLWAVFGTAFWDLAPDLELQLGLRFDHQEIAFRSSVNSDYSADEWQPRIALTKTWSEDLMTYASIARGFRGGGTNGPGAPNPTFKGDSVWTYELGTKFRAYDGRLVATGALFYNDYSDFIGQNSLAPSTSGAGFVGINLNTGDVKSYGVEGEFTLRATSSWTLQGGFMLQNARITDDTPYRTTTGRLLPSDRIPFQPDWTWNLQTRHRWAVGSGDLEFSLGAVAKGERNGASLSNTFAPRLESYTLVNTALTYEIGDVEMAVFANNLFEEDYYESFIDSSVLTVAGLPALGSLGLKGDGRRVGARIRYRF